MNTLCIKPIYGLCNRIRTVISAHALSLVLGKKFAVCWSPGIEFSSDSFDDLFNYKVNLITETQYNSYKEKAFNIDKILYKNLYDPLNNFRSKEFSILDSINFAYEGNLEFEWFLNHSDNAHLFNNNYEQTKIKLYQMLKPSAKVLRIIESVPAFDPESTIGVHIRRGDITTDGLLADHYAISTTKAFHGLINRLLIKRPNLNFYLATDDSNVLSEFIAKYGNKILYLNKTFVNSTLGNVKLGQLEATAELFLLAKTRQIIGNNLSSFSQTASKIGRIHHRAAHGRIKGKRLSIISACMDRTDSLMKSIQTWLQFKEIDEIVIVDWSSKTPIIQELEKLKDPRIIVIRVEGQICWVLSEAYNLAAKMARGRILLKLDSDYCLHEDFLKKHPLDIGMFYCGNWRKAKNTNELSLSGLCYLPRRDFFLINGYNEKIKTYGWDDDDLYNRLEKTGLIRMDIKNAYVQHTEHSNAARIKNQNVINHKEEIQKNKQIAQNYNWSVNDQLSQYKLIKNLSNYVICRKIENEIDIENHDLNEILSEIETEAGHAPEADAKSVPPRRKLL